MDRLDISKTAAESPTSFKRSINVDCLKPFHERSLLVLLYQCCIYMLHKNGPGKKVVVLQ